MAVVTVHSDFGAQEYKVYHCFHRLPIYLPWSDGTRCHDLRFLNVELSLSPSSRGSLVLFSICISEFIDISPGNLDSSLSSSSPAFCMMYFACNLNKQVDNMQTWCTPFPIWNQLLVPCPILTVTSWPAYRFLRKQVRWSDIPVSLRIFQFVVIYTVKCFSVVNEAEVDVFLESSSFFYDATDVDNLISGSSAFSKSSFYISKFLVHILLKSSLKDFEHYFASMWNECNCAVVQIFFGIVFLWDWNENRPFPVLWSLVSFPNLLAYWVQHFTSIIF